VSVSDHRTISAAFVRAISARQPLSANQQSALLTECDIPESVLTSDRARVRPIQFARLLEAVTQLSGDESLGYNKHPQRPGTMTALMRYAHNSDDLLQAFERHIELFNLFDSGYKVSLQQRDNYAFYRLEPETGFELAPWTCEQHMMMHHRYFCWLCGTRLPLLRVNLHYPPPRHRDEYHYLFHTETRFNQPHADFVFSRRLLSLPVVRSNTELEDYLQRVPYELLHMPDQEGSYTEQIRRYLKKSLPQLPNYEHIAEALGVGAQTLRRRLAQEGCDYRQLKHELLRDLAIDLLADPELDIKSISYQLGFSEPSAFIRSFKKWTGSSPGEYRRNNTISTEQDAVKPLL
jgi:AraC-like DNA-binding protein